MEEKAKQMNAEIKKTLFGRPLGTSAARIAHYENFFNGYRDFVIGHIRSSDVSPFPKGSPQDKSYREGAKLAEFDLS